MVHTVRRCPTAFSVDWCITVLLAKRGTIPRLIWGAAVEKVVVSAARLGEVCLSELGVKPRESKREGPLCLFTRVEEPIVCVTQALNSAPPQIVPFFACRTVILTRGN